MRAILPHRAFLFTASYFFEKKRGKIFMYIFYIFAKISMPIQALYGKFFATWQKTYFFI
jgi:hypothetical protein